MGEFFNPQGFNNGLVHITTGSSCSIGGMAIKGNGVNAGTAWPFANTALFVPFRLAAPFTFNTLFVVNGTSSGNLDLGIYNADGTKLISTGSVASAANVATYSVTTTTLPAGLYYIAMAADNTTIAPFAFNTLGNAAFMRMCGLAQQGSALPLPATATFAAYTAVMVPYIGLSARSVI